MAAWSRARLEVVPVVSWEQDWHGMGHGWAGLLHSAVAQAVSKIPWALSLTSMGMLIFLSVDLGG